MENRKLRDSLKSPEHFDQELQQLENSIATARELIAARATKPPRPGRPDTLSTGIGHDLIDKALCLYSAGYDTNEIAPTVAAAITQYSIAPDFDPKHVEYFGYVRATSLALLLDLDNDSLIQLLEIADRTQLNDRLTNAMLATRISAPTPSADMTMSVFYRDLSVVLDKLPDESEQAVRLLGTYLRDKWFGNHQSFPWHGSHRKERGYYGYWSVETAALVRCFDLDDAPLFDLPYYPRDLVCPGGRVRGGAW